MTLTLGRTDVERGPWRGTLLVIAAWTLWLIFISLFSVSDLVKLPMTGLVLVYGARIWSWVWAGFALLFMAWIYHQWSLVPPGLFWLAAFITFITLKIYISQFELDSLLKLMTAFLIAFVLLEALQLFFFYRLFKDHEFSWSLMGAIFLSAMVQSLFGFAFNKSLRGAT